jgi:YVTN family beta-propeller protein
MLGSELHPEAQLAAPAPGADARAATRADGAVAPPATPRADCGPGSRPAPGLQGRVTADAPADGYTCNTELVGHEGHAGGFKVERFVDRAGHQCAYYDTTLLFPVQAIQQLQDQATGVAVVDMTDPAHPVRTATLETPAMQTPHESLLVNERRGLLAAVMGNPTTYPGFVDIYDLNADCRHPELQSSLPVGLLGHESGFAPDGKTFYATSLFSGTVTAVDVTNPKVPVTLWVGNYPSHGFTLSDDGNRGYVAGLNTGLMVLDTSQIQARRPNPQVTTISTLRWPVMTIPQVAIPVRLGGKPALVEVDEFSTDAQNSSFPAANGQIVGAARIIDISDEKAPKVMSDMRLEVNQPEHRAEIAGDPGASSPVQGYAAHYCNVPQEDDPPIVACSFINSGLRVFDIRDPYHPREVAYFVAPPSPSPSGERSDYAMSKPSFDVARHEVWYADGNSGLYAVRLTNGAWPAAGTTSGGTDTGATRCKRVRRAVVMRVPRHLRHAKGVVNGRHVKVQRLKHHRVRLTLRHVRKATALVKVTGRVGYGRWMRKTHRYRVCSAR